MSFSRGNLSVTRWQSSAANCFWTFRYIDPFRNDTEPFYVSCFLGEVDAGGVTTKSAFLTTYERVQAQLGAGVAEELTHCKLWLDRYSGLTEVARLFEDAFRKRQTKSAEQKGLLGRIAAEIRVGKPSRPYPPIYDYVQSLLQFHLKNYSQSLAHAEKYAAIFTDESEASDRQRMERMIESIRQKL
jgi:hypothetical protein